MYSAESWDPVVAGAVALAGFLVVHVALVVGDNRGDVELALRASHWLGSSVLGPATAADAESPRGRKDAG